MISARSQKHKGFSLLLAVLMGSLILSVGLGIFNLTFKESIISASGRESQYALYAADSGIECALYYDVGKNTGSGATEPNFAPYSILTSQKLAAMPYGGPLVCNGVTVTLDPAWPGEQTSTTMSTTTFKYNLPADTYSQPCVSVSVSKAKRPTDTATTTFIQARGYNTCDTSNPRRVERGLFIRY